jgi:hypothetical protein
MSGLEILTAFVLSGCVVVLLVVMAITTLPMEDEQEDQRSQRRY